MHSFSTDYHFLNGLPKSKGIIRTKNEDFCVYEIPAFEPDGEGEHWYFKIRKDGENTDWVANMLAEFFQVSSKEIGYAGKKDRYAITEQWFSVCLPGVMEVDVTGFDTDSVQIIEIKKHSRKLRTGALKGNTFSITLRGLDNVNDFQKRISLIEEGVPNYFGEQRFGHGGGNIRRGIGLLKKEFKERNRTRKGMYISAVRSWFFNYILSHRIDDGLWNKPISGDVVMLNGSHSHFTVEDLEEIRGRLVIKDVHLTGPMLGKGQPLPTAEALDWETKNLLEYDSIIERLADVGMKQERRSLRLIPEHLKAEAIEEGVWKVSFDLPSGSFATSVLRELCVYENAGAKT